VLPSNKYNSVISAASFQYHTVKKGENLTKIANKYNVSVESIKKLNSFKNADKLYVGKKIKIPKGKTAASFKYHRVKRGENLSTIAKKYRVSVSSIKAHNELKNPNNLYVGTNLKIPVDSSSASTKTASKSENYAVDKSNIKKAGLTFSWPVKTLGE
jgi:LysM repeat protein